MHAEAITKVRYVDCYRNLYFGSKVWQGGKDIKANINNKLNKYYINPHKLPSGRNETGLFLELRKKIVWPEHCKNEAKNSVELRMKSALTNGEKSIIITEEKDFEYYFKEKYSVLVIEWDSSWSGPTWLTFIMCGKPGKWGQIKTLMSGGVQTLENDQIMEKSRNIFETKSDRRLHDIEEPELKFKMKKNNKIA